MQLQLAECIADVQCFESLLCLQGCNGRADETDCQVSATRLHTDWPVQEAHVPDKHTCMEPGRPGLLLRSVYVLCTASPLTTNLAVSA